MPVAKGDRKEAKVIVCLGCPDRKEKKKRKFGVLVQSKNSILGFRKTLDKTYS